MKSRLKSKASKRDKAKPPRGFVKTHREPSTAERMSKLQREISISEFFAKNRHLLGFDNPKKSLLTTVKEAVDNSLDACEEARILPEITVLVESVASNAEQLRVTIEDNGPGIVRTQVPKIFGKLLYGSKFHRLKMSRGQQGIGISAAVLFGQLTTGRPAVIISRPERAKKATRVVLEIDTAKNTPTVIEESEIDWDRPHGTSISVEIEAKYQKGRQSVDDFIRQCLISNPHATFRLISPDGERLEFARELEALPDEPKEIKPHPHGIEVGVLHKMASNSQAKTAVEFLMREFSRVSESVAAEILTKAGLSPKLSVAKIDSAGAEKIVNAVKQVKIMAPPSNCVVPMGEEAILKGLKRDIQADFAVATSRSPVVYRGNPFVIEAGIAYGGSMPGDEPIQVLRFANRVPLLYQQSACVMTKSIMKNEWRNYGLQQSKGALPIGPMIVFVHMASVWVPFTSESKEAIADYPEIRQEIRLAIQECGRKLGIFINRRRHSLESERKASYIDKYIPHIGEALKEMLALSESEQQLCIENLRVILERGRIEV